MSLILVAHGTRDPAGAVTVEAIAASVRRRLGGVPVHVAYADVREPTVGRVLDRVPGPAVLVPAFLAAGYHVRVDVPGQVADTGRTDVSSTDSLGPHPAVVAAVHERLISAGWRPGDAVVLAAAGSSNPIALADVRRAATLLGTRLGTPVRIGYVATAAPRVPDAVAAARADAPAGTRIAIAPWLLAPGLFQRSLTESGADLVADPIGDHPRIADLIVRRYLAARYYPAAPLAVPAAA